jgi:hypothetical protein
MNHIANRLTPWIMIAAVVAAAVITQPLRAAEPTHIVSLPTVVVTGKRIQVVKLDQVVVTAKRVAPEQTMVAQRGVRSAPTSGRV